jgi:hypothetical protein
MPSSQQKSGNGQSELFTVQLPRAGSLNWDARIRDAVKDSIKECSKSRAAIAEEMSYLLGERVTEQMLNCYTAESKQQHRFPLLFVPAFCVVTGSPELLSIAAFLLGFATIDAENQQLLELGRQYLLRKESEAKIAELENVLKGRRA